MRVVAIEEHHLLSGPWAPFDASTMPEIMRERLFAPLDRRLADMDGAGIE
jgi:hypothetical protein